MIYFDHAATSPMEPEVIEAMVESMRTDFANAGTVYSIGLEAKRRVEEAQASIAQCLALPSGYSIVFTSGGSEANNLFIRGLCYPDRSTACTGLEHPSVVATLNSMEEWGNPPVVLSQYSKDGVFDLSAIPELNAMRIRLLCLGHVNNELGIVQPTQAIARRLQEESLQTRLFIDGVQAAGKWRYTPDFWKGVAGYSLSAHKFKGPKAIGALVYDSRLDLKPSIHGGGQQGGVRSGTLPVPLICGMAHALRLATDRLQETRDRLEVLQHHLIVGLQELEKAISELSLRFNSIESRDWGVQSPAIVNFSFAPVEGEVLLHHLEEKQIYVGLGSACSAHSKEPSKILLGVGCTVEEALCSLRVSFDHTNTIAEVDTFLREFRQAYESLLPTFRNRLAHS